MLKFNKGIDYKQASKIIGSHFPEVNDKLLNILQLYEDGHKSELLLASIEQKSTQLKPVPFVRAINLKKNIKYLKYALVPISILLLAYLTGKINWFSDSYERVVNYKMAYQPPAPFEFFIQNDSLQAIENTNFKLGVKTHGNVVPDNVRIVYNGQSYLLKSNGIGSFEHTFEQPNKNIQFHLEANNVVSTPYTLSVLETPSLVNFEMVLDYPAYTLKQDEVLKSTGNAIVPQGTKITWKLKTKTTDQVFIYAKDTTEFDIQTKNIFQQTKQVFKDLDYTLSTSNKDLRDFEKLAYRINVTKDEFPEIDVEAQIDSLDNQTLYFLGRISDDYGLSKLQLTYYPVDDERNKSVLEIPVTKSNFEEFIRIFPDNITLKEGVSYELFFEVFDNDAVNGRKSAKSQVFKYRELTKSEKEAKQLEDQNNTIRNLDNSLEKFEDQERQLKELSKLQKEKNELNFNDKKKFQDFLKRQMRQEEMMENFNKKLQENLDKFQEENKETDEFKEDLKERLKDNQEQLKRDEKLLEELQKLADKINKEEFTEKLEQLAKQSKNQKRSMQQLLELTKRYYVSKKMEKLANELNELSKKQEKLSEESFEKNSKEKQDELNRLFENLQKEMDSLSKDNKALRKPMDIPRDKTTEKEINLNQNQASDELQQKENSNDKDKQQESQNNAQKKQKKASQKMKQLSMQMMSAMQMSSGEQIQEDMEMIRQMLDNLLLFSFNQEDLMQSFETMSIDHNAYPKNLRKQFDLREHFQHIDDSLFALSLRQPKISEQINKEISEVYYSIDRSLDQLSENLIYQGVSSQQYSITAANNLANLLSNMLDNLQMSMSGQGQGQDGEQGLPDIIISQEELKKQMEEGMKKSQEGQPKDGQSGKEGEGQQQNEGKSGKEREGKGKEGQNSNQLGDGEGSSENINGQLYEIYQRQQQLRNLLKDKLGKLGESGLGKQVLEKMEEVELDLINEGFTNKTLEKMNQLQHQLLKLENAAFTQGFDNMRESETNDKLYERPPNTSLEEIKKYFNTTEILNRQSLPLQPVYKKKVQEYFKNTND